MIPFAVNVRMPMVPNNGGLSGLKEKRVLAVSSLALGDSATQYGDKNKSIWDTMTLDGSLALHNNHGSDPGSDTLNLIDSASLTMTMLRPTESTLNLTDHAHAVLDGHHPAGEDLIQHDLTANETMVSGQPVYISSSNTVNLANATTLATANIIGLVSVGGTANNTVQVQTDGAVYLADWTSITGTINLTPGMYYLDTTAGRMTTTPPSADGNVIVAIGTALNTKTFDIEVNEVAIL